MPIMDDMRKALGLRTREDHAAVERGLQDLARDPRPEARLAMDIAELAAPSREGAGRRGLPDGMVRIMLPELAQDARPLPRDPSARRLTIAEAALRAAGHHVENGSDERLGPELGRATRKHAVAGINAMEAGGVPLANVLARRSARTGRQVAAYLAHGPKVEEHHRDMVRDLPARGRVRETVTRLASLPEANAGRAPESGPALGAWIDKGLRAERGIARAGLMPPERIVAAAAATMRDAPDARLAALSLEPRARPDFQAAAKLDATARRSEAERWTTTSDRATPPAAARNDVSKETPQARPAPAAALAAAARDRGL